MRSILNPRGWLVVFLLASALVWAEPPMTKITVHVTNHHDKPVAGAAVIVRFVSGHSVFKLGRGTKTEWELQTNQEGSITLPRIPQGKVLVQVIAKGFQTYGETLDISEEEKTVDVHLKPPQAQYTAH